MAIELRTLDKENAGSNPAQPLASCLTLHSSSSFSYTNEYLSMVDICVRIVRVLIAARLDASQRRRDGIRLKSKVLWSILRIGYCIIWERRIYLRGGSYPNWWIHDPPTPAQQHPLLATDQTQQYSSHVRTWLPQDRWGEIRLLLVWATNVSISTLKCKMGWLGIIINLCTANYQLSRKRIKSLVCCKMEIIEST